MHHELTWSATQLRRLKELQATPAQRKLTFEDESSRDRSFQEIADVLGRKTRNCLQASTARGAAIESIVRSALPEEPWQNIDF